MYKAISANKRNTILIMAVFIAIIGAIGWIVSYFYGDVNIAYYIIGFATFYAILQYFVATSLSIAMTGSHQIQKSDNPRLYKVVENIAITTGSPTPKIYIIDDPAPNAMASGRDPRHSMVAATTGLINLLDDNELEAVMAHEMGHIQNYDIRVSMITFGLVSAIGLISDIVMRIFIFGDSDDDKSPITLIIGLIVVILAPIAAVIVQMAVSRQREYLADASSALTTRNPEGLASALEKLKMYGKPMMKQNSATAHLFFTSPLKPGILSKLFSTHPPIEERISRLRNNAGKF